MSAVSIVDNTTGSTLTTAPTMNQVLKANATQGTSWQWYRRKSGSTTKETISGATAKTYTVKASDVGYEISVLVKQSGYASTYSNFTNAAVSILPSAPSVTNATDSSVTISANGNSAFKYEFGYLRADQNTLITPMDGTYAYNASVAVNNLQRNKNYKFYTRIAEATDGSYPASEWSLAKTATTLKSNITGTPKLGSAINNGDILSLNMETANGQTGTWKLERMDANGASKVADITFNESNNTAEYTLTTADVGNRIKATFTGNGDFQGSQSVLSDVIQKSTTTAPSAPTEVSRTDKSIIVKVEDTGTYDIGYATSADGGKNEVKKVSGQTGVTILNLSRNKDYYIFARKSETDASVASPWSNYLSVKTNKTSIPSSALTSSGTAKVDEKMTVTMPRSTQLNVDFTGTWKLERVNGTSTTTISPSNYTVVNNTLTYTIKPNDAGNKLKVTFTGNGDFKDSIELETQAVSNAGQVSNLTISDAVVSDIKDHSLKVQMSKGTDTYQFSYKRKGALAGGIVEATVSAGTDVLIDGLERNVEYEISVRKAEKKGYDGSNPQVIGTFKTGKSALTGTVEYVKIENGNEVPAKVGIAEVNATYKAKYIHGKYDQTGFDAAGHWQWYADGKPIAGATNDTYKIDPMTNVDEITVRFIADDTSDFEGYRLASIGILTKPVYNPPTALPTVTALSEDGNTGSKLSIKSNEVDHVFYYIQKEENTSVPSIILASVAEKNEAKANQWFTATADMTLNLEANTSYVVYVARLEDGDHLSSGVISQNAVRTVKDDIRQIDSISISEADTTKWKVLQDKELRIHRDNKPVEGVWQYYVSQAKDDANSWQNVTAEVKVNSVEGKTADYTFTKVNVPLKYANGYYIRAVFTGRGDLEGSKTYASNEVLIGTQIKGSVVLSTGNTSEVFVPIKANYIYAKDNGQDIVDEQNGIWTWYRETSVGSGQYEKINRDSDTVGISDQYTPTSEDVEKKIYATYTGALDGIYSGSVTSNTLDNVKRALQETPENITLKQVNGTSVQINLPTNMKTTWKTIAQPQLEYRIEGTNIWSKNSVGDAWITGLKANTKYEVRVLFEGTSEYEPSAYGTTISITTGNQSFDEENLEITQPTILETGNEITATFSGSGYDEGYFVIKRSDGTVIQDKVQGIVTKGFLFKSSSATMKYTIASDDIGSNIIIEFKAKDDAETYGGSIEKSTKEVSKPINPTKAGTPILNTVQYDETVLRVEVNDANEYVFNESATEVSETSGDWQKLTKDAGQTYHTFTGLDTKEYYLHVRTAETQTYRYSKEDVSAATKPWASTQYKITYEGMDGATNGNPTNPTQYTEISAEIKLNDASKDGYTFAGWTTDTIITPTKELTIPIHSSGDKTFTANWTINTYNITYSGGGTASPINPTTYTVETDEFTLTNPTKEGYTFTGWTGTDLLDKQETVTIPKGTFGNKTYTANWEIDTYTITYVLDGGTVSTPNNNTYTFESDTFTLTNPTKTGYTFKGWSGTDITDKEETITITKGSIGNKSYTANWDIIEYTIGYDLDGGTISTPNKDMYTVESDTFTLTNPTKTGYTFKGWSGTDITNKEDSVTITKGSIGNRTYKANWEIDTYTITYVLDGGTNHADNPSTYQVTDSSITLKEPSKTGYAFKGWKLNGTGEVLTTVIIASGSAGNLSYSAVFEKVNYKVTFDSQGGSAVSETGANYQEKISKPIDPTKEGYAFKGWFKEAGCANEWVFNTDVVEQATTLYAKWTINQYTVSFDGNGGSNGTAIKKDYNAKLETLPTSTRTGYDFVGWYTAKTGGNKITEDTKMPVDGATYYAQWKIVGYAIRYNLNGGVNNVDNPSKYTIETADITLKAPTKENYVFTGWTWDTQATPQKVVKISKGTTGAKEYSANWRAADHTVIFDSKGGSAIENGFGTHNEIMEAPSNPTKEGYTFIGWYKEEALTNQWNFESDIVISDMTLYAKWEINHYDVTFDTNEGSAIAKQIVDHGEKASKPANDPTKDYYTFVGWYSDEKLETKFNFNTLIKASTTIYAKWSAKSYDITYVLDGGKNHKDNPASYTVEDEITLKSPTKENYTFVGWTWSGQSEPQKEVIIVKGSHDSITYKANWKINEYQVSFETNGGNKIDAITKEHGSKITKPADPAKDQYIFVGWYSDEKLTKPWKFNNDVVTKEITLYAKYYAILHNVTASSAGAVEKNTEITLSSKEDATIYYTVDGSMPSKDSLKYTEKILIDKTMSIKALAVKEGYGDSEVATFEYTVKGDSAIESEKDSPLKPENKKDEIIEAVLTDKEYESYLSGTDVSVRIACNTVTEQMNDIIKNALDGRTVGTYYDITIYKTIGDKDESVVTTLRKPIRFVLTIPSTLYPEKGVTRVFDAIRIHDDKASILNDLDKDETTVTIESDAFSTYILCYKDTKTNEEDKPVIAPIEKPTTGSNTGSQVTDKPTQGITSNTPEDKKEEPKKEDVIKPTDEKESKKYEPHNMIYYSTIPLVIIIAFGVVIFLKLRSKNKQ